MGGLYGWHRQSLTLFEGEIDLGQPLVVTAVTVPCDEERKALISTVHCAKLCAGWGDYEEKSYRACNFVLSFSSHANPLERNYQAWFEGYIPDLPS